MKNIIQCSLILMITILCSCGKDLNVKPQSIVAANSMWQTQNDAEGAMYGMFAQLRNALNDNYVYWGDYRSGLFGDGLGSEGKLQDIFNNTLGRDNAGTNWNGLYTTINDCNLILKHTPKIHFDHEETKSFILANAHFVRALCYYYCARVWGDAPIVLSGFESDKQKDLYPSRSPADSVLMRVATDVNKAIALFPSDDVTSRKLGSKAAANMLKADYCLWMAKTQNGDITYLKEADEAVDAVLNNADLSLLNDYGKIFTNEGNNEIIFALNFEKNEYEGGFAADYLIPVQFVHTQSLINNPIQVGSHQQWVIFTPQFQSFLYQDPNDSRARVNVDTFTDPGNNAHFRWINKYLGEFDDGTRYFTSDIVVYRYAEAVLFKAEIQNALGNGSEAVAALNRVAKRAYGIDNYYSSSLSGTEIDKAILNERLKEFAAEGKSWFDLIRFGVAFDRIASLKGKEGNKNILLWPVNAASINSNPNIKQTPGYN